MFHFELNVKCQGKERLPDGKFVKDRELYLQKVREVRYAFGKECRAKGVVSLRNFTEPLPEPPKPAPKEITEESIKAHQEFVHNFFRSCSGSLPRE